MEGQIPRGLDEDLREVSSGNAGNDEASSETYN
jgi:hypothetical protein